MKDHKIDEIFKSKLDGQGIPYKGQYWADMERTIAKTNHSKIYLGIFLLFAFSLSIAWFWLPNPKQIDTTKPHDSVVVNQPLREKAIDAHSSSILLKKPVQDNTSASPFSPTRKNPITQVTAESSYLSKVPNPSTQAVFDASTSPGANDSSPESNDVHTIDYERVWFQPRNQFPKLDYSLNEAPVDNLDLYTWRRKPCLNIYVGALWGLSNNNRRLQKGLEIGQKVNEKALQTQVYGIQGGVLFRRFQLQMGLLRESYVEQTNYSMEEETVSYDTTYTHIRRNYTTTPRGTEVGLLETHVTSTASVSVTDLCPDCRARFNYITIPLQLGYRLKLNRLNLQPHIGASVSFLQSATGLYSDAIHHGNPTGEPASFHLNTLESSTNSRKVLLGYSYGADLQLALTSRASVLLNWTRRIRKNGPLLTYQQSWLSNQFGIGFQYLIM